MKPLTIGTEKTSLSMPPFATRIALYSTLLDAHGQGVLWTRTALGVLAVLTGEPCPAMADLPVLGDLYAAGVEARHSGLPSTEVWQAMQPALVEFIHTVGGNPDADKIKTVADFSDPERDAGPVTGASSPSSTEATPSSG